MYTYDIDLLETGALGEEERLACVDQNVVEIGAPVATGLLALEQETHDFLHNQQQKTTTKERTFIE